VRRPLHQASPRERVGIGPDAGRGVLWSSDVVRLALLATLRGPAASSHRVRTPPFSLVQVGPANGEGLCKAARHIEHGRRRRRDGGDSGGGVDHVVPQHRIARPRLVHDARGAVFDAVADDRSALEAEIALEPMDLDVSNVQPTRALEERVLHREEGCLTEGGARVRVVQPRVDDGRIVVGLVKVLPERPVGQNLGGHRH